MLARFVSNLVCVTLGAVLVVIATALAPAAVGWVALGVGSATVLVSAAAFPARGRGRAQRFLDMLTALLGGWMIVAACAFGGAALRWLSFAGAAALCAFGLAGLIAHEMVMERAVREETSPAARNGRARGAVPLSERSGVSAW